MTEIRIVGTAHVSQKSVEEVRIKCHMISGRSGDLSRSGPGNKIDYRYVTEWFSQMRDKYGIIAYYTGYDSWNSPAWIEDMEGRLGYKKGSNLLPGDHGSQDIKRTHETARGRPGQ